MKFKKGYLRVSGERIDSMSGQWVETHSQVWTATEVGWQNARNVLGPWSKRADYRNLSITFGFTQETDTPVQAWSEVKDMLDTEWVPATKPQPAGRVIVIFGHLEGGIGDAVGPFGTYEEAVGWADCQDAEYITRLVEKPT